MAQEGIWFVFFFYKKKGNVTIQLRELERPLSIHSIFLCIDFYSSIFFL